jgi:ABC-type antimicrobial peptide transport system permease subunit
MADSAPTLVGDALDRGLSRDRLVADLSAAFGVLALTLACIGLYGVLSYAVARRTSELGVRMAVGARTSDVLRLVMREALALTALGVGIGVTVAVASSRFIQALLFGVTPTDPPTYIAVAVALLVVAIAAAFLPARRASRVDPMVALRCD